jgi:riboflavin kinase/FMN adenylyltransferase
VSSTRIRALIADGNLDEANDFLGHPFRLVERVIHGDRRGRTIGFPTANLPIQPQAAMLPNGAYAVRVQAGGRWYGGMANIGDNPTFAGCTRRVEVNIADFSGDLYDRVIVVDFLAKLRDEQTFASADQLVRQLRKDRENAEKIWRKR